MKRLEYKVFRAMQTAGSALYEPGLAAVLVKKREVERPRQGMMSMAVLPSYLRVS